MKKIYENYEQNEDIFIIKWGEVNETHKGEVFVDIKADLPVFIVHIKVESVERKFIDHTTNLCKWNENRCGNFLVQMFDTVIDKYYNKILFQCPLKKGLYWAVKPRAKQMNTNDIIPAFVPLKGSVNFTVRARTLIKKRPISLFNTTHIYEFDSGS